MDAVIDDIEQEHHGILLSISKSSTVYINFIYAYVGILATSFLPPACPDWRILRPSMTPPKLGSSSLMGCVDSLPEFNKF